MDAGSSPQGPLADPLPAGEITSPISPKMINWILEFGESHPYPNQDSVIFFKQPRDKPWKTVNLSLRHDVTHEAQILRRGFRRNRDTARRSLEKDNPLPLMPRIMPMQDISHDKPICNFLSFRPFFIFFVFLSYRKRRTFLHYLDDLDILKGNCKKSNWKLKYGKS